MTRFQSILSTAAAVLLGLCSILASATASADTILVDSTEDVPDRNLTTERACWTGTACTLRAAIQTANAYPGPHTIIILPGVYTITIPGAFEDNAATGDFDIRNDVDIFSMETASSVVIQGGPTLATSLDRVFHIIPTAAKPLQVTIRRVTIRNGHDPNTYGPSATGGGIEFSAPDARSSLTLEGVAITGNSEVGDGGGVHVVNADASSLMPFTMTGSIVTGNASTYNLGGGMFLQNVAATIADSTISSNTSSFGGGGIFHYNGTASFTGTTISGNVSSGLGGGIALLSLTSGSSVSFDHCIIDGNSGTSGGGVQVRRNTAGVIGVNITGTTVTNNRATSSSNGGGGFELSYTLTTVIDSTFSGNSAAGGGGMAAMSSNVSIDRSLFTANSATSAGGGLVFWAGTGLSLAVSNSTFSGNTAVQLGAGMYVATAAGYSATLRNVTITSNMSSTSGEHNVVLGNSPVTMHNSIIGRGISATFAAASSNNILGQGVTGITNGVNGNRIGINPLLSTLENRGGSAALFPLPGSPALDSGNNAEATGYDQRGFMRIADCADPDAIATVDIGAVEVFPTISDITNQSTIVGSPLVLPFYVGDATLGLTITAVSDNDAVVPTALLSFTNAATNNPTLLLSPASPGIANITVTVSFSGLIATDVFSVNVIPPDFAISKTHSPLMQGGTGTYQINVTNVGAGTSAGTVTVVDTLPPSLTLTSIAGSGWTCDRATATCTRNENLTRGAAWPPIVASVNVSSSAPGSVTNQATVSGGGDVNLANNIALDPTSITPRALTTTTIAAPTFTYGTAASITLTVESTSGTPTGSVSLVVDSNNLTATLSGGTATFTVPSLNAGSHALVASYGGNSEYQPSSNSGSLTVDRAATSLAISAPSIAYGEAATIVVTATSPGGTPSGDLSLTVGLTTQTQPLVAGGATFSFTALTPDTYSVTANLPETTNFLAGNATGTLSVERAATTVAISAPAVMFGNPATATVSVTSPTATPAGTISLTVDGGAPSSLPLAGGIATFPIPASLAGGDHPLVATYIATPPFFNDGSSNGTLHIDPATTTLSVSAPAITYGENSTVTVMIASPAGTPAGSVSLVVDGGAPIPQPLVAGSATFTLPSPAGGDHALSGSYAGDLDFGASSDAATLHVNPAGTLLAIDAPAITFGQSVTITVTMSSSAGTPDGVIALSVDGGATIEQTLAGGLATFTVPSLGGGAHTVAASYAGCANFAAAGGSSTLHVSEASSSFSITSPTIIYGSIATITLNSTAAAGTPTGNVTLTLDGGSEQTLPLIDGAATFAFTSLAGATYAVHATYAGDTNFLGSTAGSTLTVDPAPTSLVINAPVTVFGNDATITVTISSPAPTPSGSLSLSIDGAPFSQPLAGGIATFTIPNPAGGDHLIDTSFAGSTNYVASTANATLHVDPAATSLSVDAPSIVYGANAIVKVTISSVPGAAGGAVRLSVDGSTAVSQPLVGGIASFSIASIAGGDHSLGASYAGNLDFAAAKGSGSVHVDPAPTTLTIAAPTIIYGDVATITVTIASTAGTPPGAVSLALDGGTPVIVPLVAGLATWTVPSLNAGPHAIAATYAGNADFTPGSASSTLNVSQAPTAIAINGTSPAPSTPGESVKVFFSVNAPTGMVTVTGGASSCTAPGTAHYCELTLPHLGTFSLVASYAGAPDYMPSTSAPFEHVVDWPPAEATVSGDSSVCQGGSATILVELSGTLPWRLTWSDGVVETATASPHRRIVTVTETTAFTLANAADQHRVANVSGSATITVREVLAGPTISGPASIVIGHPFDLIASSGFETYQWFFNGNPITGATSATLHVDVTGALSFGSYTVVGYNDGCSSHASAAFVAGAPEWLIGAVVGSAEGANGSRYRSAMHLFNRGDCPFRGGLTFQSTGAPKTAEGRNLEMLPFETRWWGDVFGEAGGSGLASADLRVGEGSAPFGLVHIYNDAGANGTTGLLEPLLDARRALVRGERAILIAPADPLRTRMNIGVRALEEGVSMHVTLRDVAGKIRTTFDQSVPASHFTQTTAAEFLGVAPGASDAIDIEITAGAAIIYGASADNRTNDPSFQFAQRPGSGEAARRIIAVVGSTDGAFGSHFRTGVQLHNASEESQVVGFTVHPQQIVKSFTIAPNATLAIGDLLPAMGLEGLATADLLASPSVISLVRVFNDGDGETSMTEDTVAEWNVSGEGTRATILAPHEPARFRFNIGVRALEEGARVHVTIRSRQGVVVAERDLLFAPMWFQQTPAEVMMDSHSPATSQ